MRHLRACRPTEGHHAPAADLRASRVAKGQRTPALDASRRAAVAAISLGLVALAGATPTAQAGPLLSGYGGPGEGSQVIVGAALANGPSGGAGSSGAGGSPGAAGSNGSGSAGAAGSGQRGGADASLSSSAGTALAGSSAGSRRAGAPGGTAGRAGQANGTSKSPAGAPQAAVFAVPSSDERRVESDTLGLTMDDLLYALLVLAALAAVWALTASLVRVDADGPLRQLKGRREGPD